MRSLLIWSILAGGFVENLSVSLVNSSQRRKRLINGEPVEQSNYYYSGVNFYVDLVDGHECANPHTWPHHCARPENNLCGGSLLTPTIVQTSCECLAAFVGPRQRNFTTACLSGTWERMFLAFVGAKDVEGQVEGYFTKKFYIHEGCAKLAVKPHYLTTYDFGFVILQRKVKQLRRSIPIMYAPIFSINNLAKFYGYNLNKGVTCLTLGYGNFRINTLGVLDPEKSSTLRHSWVIIYEYTQCFYLSGMSKESANYVDVATWVCMTRLPNYVAHSYLVSGDAGGQVTCNNLYFGIAGHHHRDLLIEFKLQIASAITFTPYQNAIEFRHEFVQNLELAIRDPKFYPTFRTLYPLVERGFTRIENQASLTRRFCLHSTALYIIMSEQVLGKLF